MRIIDSRRDYYDSVSGYNLEDDIVYVRKREETFIPKDAPPPHDILKELLMALNYIPTSIGSTFKYGNFDEELFDKAIIGFCGKLYPVLYKQATNYHINLPNSRILTNFAIDNKIKKMKNYGFYTNPVQELLLLSDEEIEHMIKMKPDKFKEMVKDSSEFRQITDWRKVHRVVQIWDIMLQDPLFSTPQDELFIYLNTPIFMIVPHYHKSAYIYTNPILKDYQFQKLFDQFQAYQTIRAYLGSVLTTNKEPVPLNVSDKDMIYKKGFDDKSFRKAPTKKK